MHHPKNPAPTGIRCSPPPSPRIQLGRRRLGRLAGAPHRCHQQPHLHLPQESPQPRFQPTLPLHLHRPRQSQPRRPRHPTSLRSCNPRLRSHNGHSNQLRCKRFPPPQRSPQLPSPASHHITLPSSFQSRLPHPPSIPARTPNHRINCSLAPCPSRPTNQPPTHRHLTQ